MRICLGCMEHIGETVDTAICPLCGYHEDTPPKEAYHLKPGTILRGRYVIGRSIGHGGFGVTYIGLDAQLERKIAVKEYLPSDFATRMPGDVRLTIYANDAREQFEAGLGSFVDEARRLARFNSMPGIVDIYDSFAENLTAYIVMQFLDGKTVKQTLQENGPFPYENAKEIIKSILLTLEGVHAESIIHRDIAPDNIFLTKDGEIKLLDFGAARYATTFHSKSLSVILKPGYAPEEQYRSRGSQGPWTDVYATAATFYKMITGVTPDESMERGMRDNVKEPSKLGVELPKQDEAAIMNAMMVRLEDRTQSAKQFYDELGGGEVERRKPTGARYDAGKFPAWMKGMITAVCIMTALGLAMWGSGLLDIVQGALISDVILANTEGMVKTPGVIKMNQQEAEEIIVESGLRVQIMGKENDDKAPRDTVMKQEPLSGRLVSEGAFLNIWVSRGPELERIPNVLDRAFEAVDAELKSLGFRVRKNEEYSEDSPAGVVIAQDALADSRMERGSIITLTVSRGLKSAESITQTTVPDVQGISFAEAKSALNNAGLYVIIDEEIHHSEYEAGIVISQDTSPGETINSGNTVHITVSKGIEKPRMPDIQFMNIEEAAALLKEMNLGITYTFEKNYIVPAMHIISQTVPEDTEVEPGSVIEVVVSQAHYAVVPDIVGMDVRTATQTLAGLGIEYSFAFVTGSTKKELSRVISQVPSPGTFREYMPAGLRPTPEEFDSKYAVTIVLDMDSDAFVSIVDTLDIPPVVTQEDSPRSSSSPPPASRPAYGNSSSRAATPSAPSRTPSSRSSSSSSRSSSSYDDTSEVAVPNVYNMTLDSALTRLTNLGLVVYVNNVYTGSEEENGRVMMQDYEAGVLVPRGTIITIEVGVYKE